MKKIIIALLFTFTFLVQITGQTTLPTLWTFINPSPTGSSTSDPTSPPSPGPTGWTTKLDIFVTGGTPFTYSTGVDGNASCRLDATGEYVMIWFTDKPGPISYYLKGTAINAPYFTGTFSIQESPDTSNWSDMQSVTSMTNSFVRYVNNPQPTTRFIRFFYTNKVSGSNVALDSIYIRSAPVSPNATINVKQGTASMVNGSTFINGKNASTLFTVENKGTSQALTLSNKSITGANASDYSINYFPTSIAANSSDTFSVSFNPASNGTRKATLTFSDNDSLKNPFVINLYGIGGNFASLPISQPTNLIFPNIKAFTFNVTFNNPNSKPEKYIVLKKKGATITEIPVNGQTYTRGDYIGAAQVAYIGSDTNFIPHNVIANATYYFSVFACNGPMGYENYLTTNPLSGSVTSGGSNIGTYYSGINTTLSTFINDLHAKINVRDTIFYGNYAITIIDNFIARDTTGGRKVVNCVYTTLPYVYNDPFLWMASGNNGTLTREHTFCQSWMPSNIGNPNFPNDAATGTHELPEYNDQHHLFPADQTYANGKRSNLPFGEVVGTPTYVSLTGMGKLGLDSSGKTVWEPRDSHKGDLARALFYMSVCYNGVNGKNWSLGAATPQNEAVLKKWHFQDPPDAWEIARHEYVASVQHNRNPFIDNVLWVNLINFTNLSLISTTTPAISIVAPNGGENWQINKNYNITWTSLNVDSVKIELVINDTIVSPVSPGVKASLGTYAWQIPNNVSLLTTKAKIKITDKLSATNSVSTNYFALGPNVGLNEVTTNANIFVFPNPSTGTITIYFNERSSEQIFVSVFDVAGRLVKTIDTRESSATINFEQKGIYFLEIKINDSVVHRKVAVE
ncbi:MAG: endonuclease [Bacteroidia bacterium]